MKYDFDQPIDRSDPACTKWGTVEAIFGCKDILPMWVADMDFPVARPIIEAMKKRLEHPIFGYSRPCPSVVESVIDRTRRKFGWDIKPEWVVFTPGVVPALNAAVKAFTHPGDEVIIQEPVYHPFRTSVTNNGCQPVINELRLTDGRYEMDLDGLERLLARRPVGMGETARRLRMIILCSPHNPVGRVWTREELTGLGELATRHGIIVVADELHCELVYKGFKHTVFATISEEFQRNCIVCMAPSKTFNLAGMSASTIIIPDPRLRERFEAARAGILPRPSIMGLVALEAAYRHGDDWLKQALEYLEANLNFLVDYFQRNIPKIKVIRPEGTYLVWLDYRGLGLEPLALRALMRDKARVGLDDGFIFGASGAGFQRMNIACPRATLEDALGRIDKAVKGLGSVSLRNGLSL